MAVLTTWLGRFRCSSMLYRGLMHNNTALTTMRALTSAETPYTAMARQAIDQLHLTSDVDGLSETLAQYALRLYDVTDLNAMSATVSSDLSLEDSQTDAVIAVAKEYANEPQSDQHCAETIAGVLLLHVSTKMQLKAAQDVHNQAASAAFGLATLLVQWNQDHHPKEASKLYQSLARLGHGLSLYQLALMSISGLHAAILC